MREAHRVAALVPRAALVALLLATIKFGNGASAHSCPCATTVVWRGPPTDLQPTFLGGGHFPNAMDLAASLGGLRLALVGDSTFRLPVQVFEAAWLGCLEGDEGSLPPSLTPVERSLCASMIRGNKSFVWMDRPLGPGGVSLSYDLWRHVEDYADLPWWTRWFEGDADLAWAAGHVAPPPDACVIGAWLWHAGYPRVAPPVDLEAIVDDYGDRVRAFLRTLTRQPAYARYWAAPDGPRRLFWRAALPTENGYSARLANGTAVPAFKHPEGVRRANAAARAAIAEVAPGIVWLDQAPLLLREAPGVEGTAPGDAPPPRLLTADGTHLRVLTSDGTHLRAPLQLVTMQHLLLTAAAAVSNGGEALAASQRCVCNNEEPDAKVLPSSPLGEVAPWLDWRGGFAVACLASVAALACCYRLALHSLRRVFHQGSATRAWLVVASAAFSWRDGLPRGSLAGLELADRRPLPSSPLSPAR